MSLTKDRARLEMGIADACENVDTARARVAVAERQGNRRAWAEAADDLDWWIGRKAFLTAWLNSGEVK